MRPGTSSERKDASPATQALNRAFLEALPFDDDSDFERVKAGKVADPSQRQIMGNLGHAVWDLDSFAFIDTETAPESVVPSLWRQGRLNAEAGLFAVSDRIHQVRGLDISNITFIAGETGWIIIDPLTSTETAKAAIDLARTHLGDRPVHAVIYTHSHTDHYGGIHGVIDERDVLEGRVEILAPAGFLDAAVSENVLAGTVMLRRATYMYGMLLPRDPKGHVDTGLGKGLPLFPTHGLLAPTREIHETGTEVTIDGVRMIFQITPGTEAPAEMNLYFPDDRVLCMAENCTANLHNVYTLRGAQVRDALAWSKYINESIELFGDGTDVLFASHHWPRWGNQEALSYLTSQRDAYRYLHDQTLRLANQGLTMNEIAEELVLPEGLGGEFFNRDYYGTMSHNSKAVYQRYLGWFDGNPAHLNPHPPVEAARRYVEFMGGADEVVSRARVSFEEGDYRWVAEVVNHVVFAHPDHEPGRLLQADALEQLGYQSESGPWRDFYLTGAQELRSAGTFLNGSGPLNQDTVRAMPTGLLLDLIGVRLNGPASAELTLMLDLVVTDRDRERWAVVFRNGVIATTEGRGCPEPDVTMSIEHDALAALAAGNRALEALIQDGLAEVTGDRSGLDSVLALLDSFSLGFEIVLP